MWVKYTVTDSRFFFKLFSSPLDSTSAVHHQENCWQRRQAFLHFTTGRRHQPATVCRRDCAKRDVFPSILRHGAIYFGSCSDYMNITHITWYILVPYKFYLLVQLFLLEEFFRKNLSVWFNIGSFKKQLTQTSQSAVTVVLDEKLVLIVVWWKFNYP